MVRAYITVYCKLQLSVFHAVHRGKRSYCRFTSMHIIKLKSAGHNKKGKILKQTKSLILI